MAAYAAAVVKEVRKVARPAVFTVYTILWTGWTKWEACLKVLMNTNTSSTPGDHGEGKQKKEWDVICNKDVVSQLVWS